MKRRQFLLRSIGGLALLNGVGGFKTLSAQRYNSLIQPGINFRFAVASDGHFGQPETKFEEFHDEVIGWLNAEHQKHPLNFSVFNGDLIHDDTSFFAEVKKKYDQLQMPYHVSRGNHDRCDAKSWVDTWGVNLNYSFESGSNAFIVLDTSNIKGEYICPDENWLNNELQKYNDKVNLFVFMHITPMKWTSAGIECNTLVDRLSSQTNLRGIFHGHDHNEDGIKTAKGKSYLFDSHIGGNWGTDYRGYRIVEITSAGDIVTYQVNPTKKDIVNRSVL
jgi:Icc protein